MPTLARVRLNYNRQVGIAAQETRSGTRRPRNVLDDAISEKDFSQQFSDAAKMYGWTMRYHTFDSRRSSPGFPDWVLIHPGRGECIFVELKNERGKLSRHQQNWIKALEAAGQRVFVFKPSDWELILLVLRG